MSLLLISFIACLPWMLLKGQNLNVTCEDRFDLNADGRINQISLQSDPELWDYVLQVDGFNLFDINRLDRYKEISVHSPGPSSDDIYMIYWYGGQQIHEMNKLSCWPEFRGNGIVYLDNWEGCWSSREKYQLDTTSRKLFRVDQYAYTVGLRKKS